MKLSYYDIEKWNYKWVYSLLNVYTYVCIDQLKWIKAVP